MLDRLLRTDAKLVDKRDPVQAVYGYLRGEVDRVPIVCDHGRPYGIVHLRRVIRGHLDPHAHLDAFTVPAPVLRPDDAIEDALRVASDDALPHVLVWDGKQRIGYVDVVDLLRESEGGPAASSCLLAVPMLGAGERVSEVLHRFAESATHVFPVLDRAGRLDGVVTRRGLLPLTMDARPSGRKAAGGEVESPLHGTIDGYVDDRYAVVLPDAPFAEVVEHLGVHGHVLVADRERFHGVVTPESAARAVADRHRREEESPEALLPEPRGRGRGA